MAHAMIPKPSMAQVKETGRASLSTHLEMRSLAGRPMGTVHQLPAGLGGSGNSRQSQDVCVFFNFPPHVKKKGIYER